MFEESMTRTFIQTDEFVKQWALLGFNDDDLRRLELMIMRNPEVALLCRKLADYVRCGSHTAVFPKSKKANLKRPRKNEVKNMIALLEEQVRELHGGDEDE